MAINFYFEISQTPGNCNFFGWSLFVADGNEPYWAHEFWRIREKTTNLLEHRAESKCPEFWAWFVFKHPRWSQKKMRNLNGFVTWWFFLGRGHQFFFIPGFFFWKFLVLLLTPWFFLCGGNESSVLGCGAWDAVEVKFEPLFCTKTRLCEPEISHPSPSPSKQIFYSAAGFMKWPTANWKPNKFRWYQRSMASATGHSKPKVLEPKALDGRNHSPKSCHPTVSNGNWSYHHIISSYHLIFSRVLKCKSWNGTWISVHFFPQVVFSWNRNLYTKPGTCCFPRCVGFARNAKWDPKKTSQALRRGLLLLQSSHRGCLRCAWQFNSEARNHLGVSARGFEVGQTIVTTIDGSDIWRSASWFGTH